MCVYGGAGMDSDLPLPVEPLHEQADRLPADGRPIVAQFDADSIVVYQAYAKPIATWAVAHQRLGGPAFSQSRMT